MGVDRHINYAQLTKACGKPGCPVCRISADREARYLDNLLFEHVSDRGFRAAHRLAGGFCPAHSRGLAAYRDGLAVAILSRDLLEDRLEDFSKGKLRKAKDRCPICVERERVEGEYLGFLCEIDAEAPEGAVDRELRRSFEAAGGLCAPHYAQLLALRKKPPAWLKAFQERRLKELLARVSAFIELSAYGRQTEFAALSEADKVVWKEAAILLRGGLD